MNDFNYHTVTDHVKLLAGVTANPKAKYIAGGTNLIDLLKYNLLRVDELFDVNNLKEEAVLQLDNGGVMLNAFATNADTAYHPLIEKNYPLLSRAILAGASAQIRNMATNGGNLLQRTRCYYFYDSTAPCNKRNPGSGCGAINGYNRIHAILGTSENCIAVFPSDMCVSLAALGAIVNVKSVDGDRTIPFTDFHRLAGDTPELDNQLKHGELIMGIELPKQGFAANYSYLKLRDRSSYAFALVSVATGLEINEQLISSAGIALGGVAHKPWRVTAAEEYLIGKKPTRENFRIAAELIIDGAVGYQYNGFKIELAKRAIVRNCMMALNPSSQLPGAQPSAD